jgi:hypothetical protein
MCHHRADSGRETVKTVRRDSLDRLHASMIKQKRNHDFIGCQGFLLIVSTSPLPASVNTRQRLSCWSQALLLTRSAACADPHADSSCASRAIDLAVLGSRKILEIRHHRFMPEKYRRDLSALRTVVVFDLFLGHPAFTLQREVHNKLLRCDAIQFKKACDISQEAGTMTANSESLLLISRSNLSCLSIASSAEHALTLCCFNFLRRSRCSRRRLVRFLARASYLRSHKSTTVTKR